MGARPTGTPVASVRGGIRTAREVIHAAEASIHAAPVEPRWALYYGTCKTTSRRLIMNAVREDVLELR